MTESIYIGILCRHSVDLEETDLWNVLFLHNEEYPLSTLISEVADGKKIRIGYFISEKEVSKDEAIEHVALLSMGLVNSTISISGSPYSEVTPEISWEIKNEFIIGGHDLNRELMKFVGKWVVFFVSQVEED